MNRNFALFLCAILWCSFWLSGCRQETAVQNPVVKSSFIQVKTYPAHDPAVKLEQGVLSMAGIGLPPKSAATDAQARVLARRAAIADGQRNLARKLTELERRSGLTRDSSSSTVVIPNYRVIEEKSLSDGGYRVVLEMQLDKSLLERLRNH